MSTIAQQLQALAQIKEEIRQAIITKGVTVASDAAFSDYATAIGQISGGDDSLLKDVISGSITGVLELPTGLTSIYTYAFYLMTGITSVIMPEGMTSIGNNSFQGCSNLTFVDLPSTINSLGNQAFIASTKIDTIICRSTTPPTSNANVFGNAANNYVGSKVTGTRKLYVPQGYTSAYTSATGGWATLLDSTKCNFTIAELDANGNIPT